MRKLKKREIITGIEIGDTIQFTDNGEKIIVTYISPTRWYLKGNLVDTPRRDQFDDGVRTTDNTCIKKIS